MHQGVRSKVLQYPINLSRLWRFKSILYQDMSSISRLHYALWSIVYQYPIKKYVWRFILILYYQDTRSISRYIVNNIVSWHTIYININRIKTYSPNQNQSHQDVQSISMSDQDVQSQSISIVSRCTIYFNVRLRRTVPIDINHIKMYGL